MTADEILRRIEGARGVATALQVLTIPNDVSTFVALTPERFEHLSEHATRRLDDPATIAAALDALAAARPRPTDRVPDVRAAYLFEDASRRRVLAVYAGSLAGYVQIDEIRCGLQELAFADWVAALNGEPPRDPRYVLEPPFDATAR